MNKSLKILQLKRLKTFLKHMKVFLLFLLDNKAAGFNTGVVLPIDGGFSAYSGV